MVTRSASWRPCSATRWPSAPRWFSPPARAVEPMRADRHHRRHARLSGLMRCSRTPDPARIRSGRPGPGAGRCGPVDVGSGQPPGLQERRDQQHAVKAAAQFLPADHLQRRRLRHHVTAQRGVAAALPRPSRPGRRAPPATRSGQPGKPGGGHGHGMNDGLRRTQRTVAPGGRGQGVSAFNARLRAGLLCRNCVADSRIAESASVFAARICSACRLYLRGCRRRLAPASRESWSCCAAWCRQPARRSGGLAAMELLIP